jgi:hypothetical protein
MPDARPVAHPAPHPDDGFHPPTSDDPSWSETCWFTFTVPERRLSGQLYPYFQPNLGVLAAGAYFWDHTGTTPADCLYAKNLWHLPIPEQPLTAIDLPNGSWYRCLEPQQQWAFGYDDSDGDEIEVDLTFTAVAPPHYLGESHVDQPGRVEGTIVLHGETIAVDAFGFRDRSWGPRTQVGPHIQGSGAAHGGYSYATASERDAFHTITMDWGEGCTNLHGYLLRDGQWSKLARAERTVAERDADGYPVEVVIEGDDELGRPLRAVGTTRNRFGFWINPNLYSMNCLTEWAFDGITAWGEDHDNHSSVGIRQLLRAHKGDT